MINNKMKLCKKELINKQKNYSKNRHRIMKIYTKKNKIKRIKTRKKNNKNLPQVILTIYLIKMI